MTIQIPLRAGNRMSLQTVIVDDEPLALDLLKLLLAEHEDIKIVAQCQNGQEAISWLQSKPVDLLFLDVQMPEAGGFDVVKQIGLRAPTAHHLCHGIPRTCSPGLRCSCSRLLDQTCGGGTTGDGPGACPQEDCGGDCSHDTGAVYSRAEWAARLDGGNPRPMYRAFL